MKITFSEDLDFTLHPDLEQKISDDEIYTAINEIFAAIKETANIDLSIPEESKEVQESGALNSLLITLAL